MNKNELVASMAEKTGLKKTEVEKVLKAFTETVASELKKGEKIHTKLEECINNKDMLPNIVKNLARIRNTDILENTYKALDELEPAVYGEEFDYLKTKTKSQIKKDVKAMLKGNK